MKRYHQLLSPLFLIALSLLLLNDFYLKASFHNWVTGKLSDFTGLFIFAFLWSTVFPKRKLSIHAITVLLFLFWKTPLSNSIIETWSSHFYPIARVVDYSDYIALLSVILSYFYNPKPLFHSTLGVSFVSIISLFSFCATSSAQESAKKYVNPQFFLVKASTYFANDFIDHFTLTETSIDDSLILINVEPNYMIDYSFHGFPNEYDIVKEKQKTALLFRKNFNLNETDTLTHYTLEVSDSSITEHLTFFGLELNGTYNKLNSQGDTLLKGQYRSGLEDSLWTYYTSNIPDSTILYELGESKQLKNISTNATKYYNTSWDLILYSQIFLSLCVLGFIGCIVGLIKKPKEPLDPIGFWLGLFLCLLLPFFCSFISHEIITILPLTNDPEFTFFGLDVIALYFIGVPVFILFLGVIGTRKLIDILYYILLYIIFSSFLKELFCLLEFTK